MEALNKLPSSHTCIGEWPKTGMDWFEFFVVHYTQSEGNLGSCAEKHLVVPCCALYVMNSEGQTVGNNMCHWAYTNGKKSVK